MSKENYLKENSVMEMPHIYGFHKVLKITMTKMKCYNSKEILRYETSGKIILEAILKALKNMGFRKCSVDPCLYIENTENGFVMRFHGLMIVYWWDMKENQVGIIPWWTEISIVILLDIQKNILDVNLRNRKLIVDYTTYHFEEFYW
jgi:hypothetical protein